MSVLKRVCFLVLLSVGLTTLLPLAGGCSLEPEALAYSRGDGWHAGNGATPTIDISQLPQEARDTISLIKQRGPFPYPKDGTIFGNRERHLPARHQGYYKEYTVKTPGSRGRGARRIIGGAEGEYYYTDDHYSTFKLIRGALP
jgi:ribonuclease T1